MRKFILGFLIVSLASAGGYYAWRSSRPREIGVCAFTDYSFRLRPNWEEVVVSRFAEANRNFANTKVQWKLLKSVSIDPTAAMGGFDQRRTALAERVDCAGDVIVSLTGEHEGRRNATVSLLTRTALVADFPQKSDAENAQILEHTLALFFGAPQEPAGAGTVMTDPPESARLSDRTVRLIRALRDYDFHSGIAALTPQWDSRAIAALTEAYTGLPANPAAQAHRALAMAWANEHKMDQAIAHLREAVKADPRNATVHGELASGLAMESEAGEAQKEMEEAIRIEPDNPTLRAAYASVLMRSADPEGAIEEAQKAVQLKPDTAIFHVALGAMLLQESGRAEEAIAAYQAALKLEPGLKLAEMGIDQAHGQKNKALEDAAEARKLAQEKPSSNLLSALGSAEAKAGNLDAAAATLQKSVQMDPKNGHAHATLAMVRYLQKDYGAAWASVDQARATNFEPPSTLVKALQRHRPR